jgi:hypothetical protein
MSLRDKVRAKPKLKRIGWMGFTDGSPFFESVTDEYSNSALIADVFRSKKEARRRFKDIREVFVRPLTAKERGGKP